MELDEERTLLQKLSLAALAAMIAVFAVLNILSTLHGGVVYQEAILQVTAEDDATIYSGRAQGEDVRIRVEPVSDTETTVDFQVGSLLHDVFSVDYPLAPVQTEHGRTVDGVRITKNGQVAFSGGYTGEETMGWYDESGKWSPQISIWATVGGDAWSGYTVDAAEAMSFAQGPEIVHRGSWALYALMVFLTALMMAETAFPMTAFRLGHCCDVRDPEPSDFYLAMLRVQWVVIPLLLLSGYIMALRTLP